MQQFLVGHKGMPHAAVFTQPIPMIGHDDGERVFGIGSLLQCFEQLAQVRILVSHFGIVQIAQHVGFQLAEWFGQGGSPAIGFAVPAAHDGAGFFAAAQIGGHFVNKFHRRRKG